MGKRIWLAVAVAMLFAASAVAGLASASPRHASDPRPVTITKGLDYLHSQQQTDGGFGTSENTIWTMLGAVASGEDIGSDLWTSGGSAPFATLQASDLSKEAAATGVNAPVYYSLAVMAYVAAGQADSVATAGSPAVDLLAQLYQYQDMTDGSPYKGRFSPSSRNPTDQAVDTTAWAILAMQAAGGGDPARFAAAVSWLAGQQNGDGGFPAHQYSASSDVEDTALAVQALIAGGRKASDPLIAGSANNPGARKFLQINQLPDGGFPFAVGGTTTDGTSTAAAIQAIVAMGESPSAWKFGTSANSPKDALAALQLKTGAYADQPADSSVPVTLTSWALVALMEQPFTTFPKAPGDQVKGFVYKPRITAAKPADGTKFTGTHTVLIVAKYTDGTKAGQVGTGVDVKACRVYVDDADRSGHAEIRSDGLHLQLKNVANGEHTYKLHIVDKAGNVQELTRTFKIAVPVPSPTPTTSPTYTPPYVPPSPSPTPSTTLYPTPSDSGSPYPDSSSSPAPGTVSGAPIPTPSPSGSAGAGVTIGSASAGGFVGAMLLAMLPIGAAVSFLAISRREHALDPAADGRVLPGGGSPWDRLKRSIGSLKNLVKPAGR